VSGKLRIIAGAWCGSLLDTWGFLVHLP